VLNRECGGSTESGGHEAGSEGLGTEVGTWIWKWDAPAQMRSSNLSISLGRYNRDWRQHVGETLSGLPNSLIRRVNTKAGEMVQFLVERGKREGEREREREEEGERERKQEKAKWKEREREREIEVLATRYSMSLHQESKRIIAELQIVRQRNAQSSSLAHS